jgi:hypothetical protein
MRHILLSILIISNLTVAPASAADKTASQKAVVWLPIAKAAILLGQDYFQTTQRAIQEAKESIYIAMYLINVEPAPTDNPASILLEGLINAHKRGISVKLILDDTKFSINYNAYKRLKDAGVAVYLDSAQAVLHGKAIVIDSRICILGSFNWSRASLSDNYEFATYIEDPQLAQTLLDYFNRIELSPEIPLFPQEYQGLKLPLDLFTAGPKPPLSELFTNHSEKAFDLYLYLARKAQAQNTNILKINYEELGKALGYTKNYYFNLFQPLNKLQYKYHLIQRKPWTKTLTLTKGTVPTGGGAPNHHAAKAAHPTLRYVGVGVGLGAYEVIIPDAYWDYGLDKKLSFPAKYMFLVSLAEAQKSQRNPYWFRSNQDLSEIYHIGERSVTNGVNELEKENILEVYRHRPEEPGEFGDRPANDYCLNPLQSDEEFRQALQSLSSKYGADITQKARQFSSQLNEPKDLQKIETYIGLINTYGYERVEEVNSEVASKRRESGFHDLSQVILLLKKNPR